MLSRGKQLSTFKFVHRFDCHRQHQAILNCVLWISGHILLPQDAAYTLLSYLLFEGKHTNHIGSLRQGGKATIIRQIPMYE